MMNEVDKHWIPSGAKARIFGGLERPAERDEAVPSQSDL